MSSDIDTIDADIAEKLTVEFNRLMYMSPREGDGKATLLTMFLAMGQKIRNMHAEKAVIKRHLDDANKDATVYSLALMVELDRRQEPIVVTIERIAEMPVCDIVWKEAADGSLSVSLDMPEMKESRSLEDGVTEPKRARTRGDC